MIPKKVEEMSWF